MHCWWLLGHGAALGWAPLSSVSGLLAVNSDGDGEGEGGADTPPGGGLPPASGPGAGHQDLLGQGRLAPAGRALGHRH